MDKPKGKMMDSGKGMYSYASNPLSQPKKVDSAAGPGSNPDQQKVNKLLKKAHMQDESLRGKAGM